MSDMKFYEVEQPESLEFTCADAVFVKQMSLPKKGMTVPQHSHTYDHTTFLATGALQVIRDGVDFGVFHAPVPIFIPAKTKHLLIAMADDTLAYCVHNLMHSGEVEIHELHTLDILPRDEAHEGAR